MSPATLRPMAKKKNTPSQQPSKSQTAVVRIDADLARMVNIVATVTGEEVAAILSPLIRSKLEERYAEIVRKLGDELPDDSKE